MKFHNFKTPCIVNPWLHRTINCQRPPGTRHAISMRKILWWRPVREYRIYYNTNGSLKKSCKQCQYRLYCKALRALTQDQNYPYGRWLRQAYYCYCFYVQRSVLGYWMQTRHHPRTCSVENSRAKALVHSKIQIINSL